MNERTVAASTVTRLKTNRRSATRDSALAGLWLGSGLPLPAGKECADSEMLIVSTALLLAHLLSVLIVTAVGIDWDCHPSCQQELKAQKWEWNRCQSICDDSGYGPGCPFMATLFRRLLRGY